MRTDTDFVVIIGAPRSGTTWLQAMVAAHPSVCSTIDELKLFDFFTVPLEEGWQYLISLQQATGGGRNGVAAMWTDQEFLSEFVGRALEKKTPLKFREIDDVAPLGLATGARSPRGRTWRAADRTLRSVLTHPSPFESTCKV